MNYELAKKLEDAGFPQNIYLGVEFYENEDTGIVKWADFNPAQDESYVKVPTLSELIEACGDDFISLTKNENEWSSLGWWPKGEEGTRGYTRPTAEEAVANLWLALNTNNLV